MLEINPELRSSAPPSKEGLSAAERVNDIMMKRAGKIKAKCNFDRLRRLKAKPRSERLCRNIKRTDFSKRGRGGRVEKI